MNGIRKTLVSAAAGVALMAAFGAARPVQAQAACVASYIVQPGDTLYHIGLSVGVSWVTLAQVNNISDPNTIYAGEVLCLPSSTSSTPTTQQPTPPPPPQPSGVVTLPPNGVFPTIALSQYYAAPGDTISITGSNFPTNVSVNIFLTPEGTPYGTSSGTATIAGDGTLNAVFTIPEIVNGNPLTGNVIGVMVKDMTTGYYGVNWFYNTKP